LKFLRLSFAAFKIFLEGNQNEINEEKLSKVKIDELVKSRNSIEFVIPAKAGIQLFQDVLDPGFRRGDDWRDFLRVHQTLNSKLFLLYRKL